MIRAAECALGDRPSPASNQVDDVELAGVARRPRRAAEAQLDFCAGSAAHHADYLRVGQFAGLGSIDGDKGVAHTNLQGN